MKSRFLTDSEKRDVAAAAIEFLKSQNPGCLIHVTVEDETDERGVPQYKATVTPPAEARNGGAAGSPA